VGDVQVGDGDQVEVLLAEVGDQAGNPGIGPDRP